MLIKTIKKDKILNKIQQKDSLKLECFLQQFVKRFKEQKIPSFLNDIITQIQEIRMQSNLQSREKRQQSNKQIQVKKKSVLPFSKQLLSLQKKIQQVEDKNQLILQRIHKAYDFKKNKNKVYYQAPGFGEDEDQEAQFQGEEFQRRGSYSPQQYQVQGRMYPSIQPQHIQPRQFEISTARKNASLVPTPAQNRYYQNIHIQTPYLQHHEFQNKNQQNVGVPLILGLGSTSYYPQYQEQQQMQIPYEHQQQENNSHMQSMSSEGQIDFKSNSNYSDVEKRKRFSDNIKKRQKDFSDIKSNIQERRTRPPKIQTKNNSKKSYIYNVIENNSLYSQGNVPSKQHLQGDDLQAVQTPITTQHIVSSIPAPKSPYKKSVTPIPSQQRIGLQSANQMHQNQYFLPQHHTMLSLPNPSPQMTYSVTNRNAPYQTQVSPNQVNFLQQMFKAERQKSSALQKQMEKKQQSIQHLKKYKKSFKRFFQDTHYVIEEAFDQFVQTFLRNRVYKIQKLVKKNENRLSALLIQLKDFKQQQVFNKSLKNLSTTKMGRKSLSINEHLQRQSQQIQSQQDQGNEQNYSTVSSRSRDRSVSAKRRKSQDKSVTKKSNQSQHLIMKKEFDNIAQNYQSMIKVKNEEIEKYELQIKQAKGTILALQEENSRLKVMLQQYQQAQSQSPQQQSQLTTSNTQSESGPSSRRNSGNLRILSRNSSRSDIKKNTISQESEQILMEKIKKYKEQVDKLQGQNGSLNQKIIQIDKIFNQKQTQIEFLTKKLKNYETQILSTHKQNIDDLQQKIKSLNEQNQQLTQKNTQIFTQLQSIKERLNQKQIKILELDSQLYLKDSELKKVQNLLTLKTHKLQQFNKLLLQPSSSQPLNDSISSVIEDPQNKTTFLMLENLQKQLQQQKYEKQIQFLKLKKSYQTKIQQLKAQLQQIIQENQKLAQRLNNDETLKKQSQQDKVYLQQINEHLKEQIQQLHKQVTFLTDKVNFYEIQKKTGSFACIPKKSQTLLLKSDSNLDHLKPQILQQHDFQDFPISQQNSSRLKQTSNWKSASGSVKLLEESGQNNTFKGKKSPSQQVQQDNKYLNVNQTNHNIQNKLSLLKDENIDLSQKVAKLQKQNLFLKENQTQLSSRSQNLKEQLTSFTKKYQELQLYNHQLLKIVQNLQKQKNQMISAFKQQNVNSPFDWKQVDKNFEPVDLKASGINSPWSFAQKDESLLDRTSKDFDIKGSIISSFIQNRPSKQSHQNSDKKIEELTKKLSQTQLVLENKQKINEQLIIGFTKKIDKLNTQHQTQTKQQAKAIQKYIQQNSKLRKEKQKLEEEIQALKNEVCKLKQKVKKQEKVDDQNFDSGVQQIKIQGNEDQQGGFDMLQQRIQGFQGNGFMLGINQVDNQSNKTPQKQEKARFQTILEQENIQFEDFQQRQQRIQLLQKQARQLQQTIEKLQKFLEETLNKVKQKQDEKTTLVEELQKKNQQVQQLRDLIELKQAGKINNLSISKQLNGIVDRPSIERSQRSRMNSVISLKYSQTHHGQRERRSSFDDDINFDYLESNNNQSLNLDHSRMSAIYSQNMSTIFQKQQNFLDQIKKAKNKRKEEGRLLKKTFQYIKKLRTSLNEKNKKIKLLEMRLQQLKDNCWLWKKNDDKKCEGENSKIQGQRLNTLQKDYQSNPNSQQHNYLDHNQSFNDEDKNKMVDSRVFECNSQDLNKKKPYRHNHYKKMEFDTKLIVEENKILNKQIQLLQQELIKIQQQQNGLMAVKELYKEQIRALTRQNQQQATIFQQQIQKLQDKLQSSEAVHNFDAIKQLFKRIIDSIGVILYPNTSPQCKKKNVHQLKEEKRKQAEECIKVICSILDYEENARNEICKKLTGQQIS